MIPRDVILDIAHATEHVCTVSNRGMERPTPESLGNLDKAIAPSCE